MTHQQRESFKLEGIESRKNMNMLTSSSQNKQNMIASTQKTDREAKYTSMPQLKQEKQGNQ